MPEATLPETPLLEGLRNRDAELLEKIVKEHARSIFCTAKAMGFGPEEAEDLVQEVFVAFLDGLDRFEGRSTTGTWLHGILVHKMQERRRARTRESRHDPIDEVAESRFDSRGAWVRPPIELHRLVSSRELGVAIEDCMRGLPGSQREVFVLRDMLDLGTDEICRIVGVSKTNMFALISRARSRLRECLEKKEISKSK